MSSAGSVFLAAIPACGIFAEALYAVYIFYCSGIAGEIVTAKMLRKYCRCRKIRFVFCISAE